jgi:hypothetical protein
MDWESIFAIVFIFGGGSLFLLSISPVGKAVADRIRGTATAPLPEHVRRELEESRAALESEVQQLRTEVSDLSERMDFAERLLAKSRETERLVPPRKP